MSAGSLPLSGVRVLDFGHTVMGPTAGLILADLGADVIRIEPVTGDPTRRLKGFGTGYFPFFNRHKQSVAREQWHGLGWIMRRFVMNFLA